MPISRIKELLQKTDRGRIVWCNIEYAINARHLDESLVKELIKKLLTSVDQTLDDDELFNEIIESMGKHISGNPNKYLFSRKQTPQFHRASSISDMPTLNRLLNAEAINKTALLMNPVESQRTVLLHQINQMGKDPEKHIQPGVKFGNPFKTFFWFTESTEIELIEEQHLSDQANNILCHDLANTVRDQLGLVHFDRNTLLIQIQIDLSSQNSSHLAAPTFIEAADHRRFKAISDNKKSESAHTADLNKVLSFKESYDPLDGVPEYVSKLIPFSHEAGCSFRTVGFTNTPPEKDITHEEADARFANILEAKNTR